MIDRSLQYLGFSEDDKHVFKTMTIHQFRDGCEVFIDERHEAYDNFTLHNIDKNAPIVERGQGDREKNIERAARRAKTKVRRLCKSMCADSMLTLTYRENMQCEKTVQAHFKAFRTRLESLGPFPYVATLERQDRGAIHLHIAVQHFPSMLKNEHGIKTKSYNVIRSMWRRVVGAENGNVDITRPRGGNSAHRIACYIAKYVSKNVGEERFNKKSYWVGKCVKLPTPIKLWFAGDTSTHDLVVLCAQEFHMRGYDQLTQYADKLNDFYWFAASRSRNRIS